MEVRNGVISVEHQPAYIQEHAASKQEEKHKSSNSLENLHCNLIII